MKINLKNVAAVLLVIGGAVGVSIAAIRSSAKSDSLPAATMSEASMVSGSSSCQMCSNGAGAQCTDGRCAPNESMSQAMTVKSMAPNSGAAKMEDSSQMVVGPKM